MKQNNEKQFKLFAFAWTPYKVFATLVSVVLTALLVYSVAFLPTFGDPKAPTVNELSTRYVEKGTEETGVINTVAGVILVYRGFDTFGEATILYVAVEGVVSMMRSKYNEDEEEEEEHK